MYTRERGACESTKLLLSALGSIFTFVYFCQLALCACVCAALNPLSQPGAGIQLSGKLILRFAFMHRAVVVVVALSAKGLSMG